MARIKKIVGIDNRDKFAIVHVLLEDGTEGTVFVGGECEVYFHNGYINVFVKKGAVEKGID